jgi:hypothetical protein
VGIPVFRLQGDHHFVVVGIVIPPRVVLLTESSIKKQRVILVDVPSLNSEHGGYSDSGAQTYSALRHVALEARIRKHQAHQASGHRELGATGRPGANWNRPSGTKHKYDRRKMRRLV